MGTINNLELMKLASFYDISIIDIIPKNELPDDQMEGNYIINMQSSYMGNGTHFVLLILNKLHSFYFDSFGEPPPIEVSDYVKRFKSKHFSCSDTQIQDLKSENCGYYCFSLLLYIKHSVNKNLIQSCKNYIKLFDLSNMARNDEILKSIYRIYTEDKIPPLINKLYKYKIK